MKAVISPVWKHDKNGRLYEGRQKIGQKQLDCMASFREPGFFVPSRGGKPWPLMRRLIDLGLMYAHREKVAIWGFDGAEWRGDEWRWRAGLTQWGQQALDPASQSEGGAGHE